MKELHELRERLCDELKGYGRKELTAGALTTIDTLAHSIKNLDKVIEGDGYSGHYPYSYDDRSYRRDSMGRYSRTGLKDKLRDLMDEAPDDQTRSELKRMIDKM